MKMQLGFGSLVLLAILILLLLASVWYAAQGFLLPGDPMPTQGYAAMFGGVFLSFVIGSSLMALLFFSSRSGYDEVPRIEMQEASQTMKCVGKIEPPPPDEESEESGSTTAILRENADRLATGYSENGIQPASFHRF